MKLLDSIPKERYNDVQWVLDHLRDNETIGNENVETIEYFHCFWHGNLTDLHLMCLDSLHKVHPTSKVILWTTDSLGVKGSSSFLKIKKLLKDQIAVTEITKDHFNEANMGRFYSHYVLLTSKLPGQSYNHDIAYASDIVRFMVLYLFGGVWFDMDIYFLRSLDTIRLNRYVSQWGTDMCGNAAILRLEKGHNLVESILKFQKPFYPTTSFQLSNDLDITMVPSTLFDILWRPEDQIPPMQFKSFEQFFSLQELNLPKQLYGYHWHNRWNFQTPNFFK